ncbi:hypothetical protein [Pseudomonas sp. UMAB-40]|uniref:hypothetical protein n=1 Tax=Pseudomonas sp. UMAB-40 TaxID=1365407 RepID=UPI001C56B430|nr:hypothetical protein [Pseudomonas sp. UMAB-40]
MADYLLVTRELLAGLYEDLERAAPGMPCLKSDAGARRNLLRLILARKPTEHARPVPTTTEELAEQAKATAERLRHGERLLRRCLPLIVEGGRNVEGGSATDAVERFLKTAYRGGEV